MISIRCFHLKIVRYRCWDKLVVSRRIQSDREPKEQLIFVLMLRDKGKGEEGGRHGGGRTFIASSLITSGRR
jgi:hypothetical protein